MRQAIIWTNADPIHWRIYAALWGNELSINIGKTLSCRLLYQTCQSKEIIPGCLNHNANHWVVYNTVSSMLIVPAGACDACVISSHYTCVPVSSVSLTCGSSWALLLMCMRKLFMPNHHALRYIIVIQRKNNTAITKRHGALCGNYLNW